MVSKRIIENVTVVSSENHLKLKRVRWPKKHPSIGHEIWVSTGAELGDEGYLEYRLFTLPNRDDVEVGRWVFIKGEPPEREDANDLLLEV